MPAARKIPGSLHQGQVLELETLLGSSWQGFLLIGGPQGLFQHSHWRKPFEAGDLASLFYRCQEVDALRRDVSRLKLELERMQELLEQYETAVAFYRHELRSASKLGLMFSSL